MRLPSVLQASFGSRPAASMPTMPVETLFLYLSFLFFLFFFARVSRITHMTNMAARAALAFDAASLFALSSALTEGAAASSSAPPPAASSDLPPPAAAGPSSSPSPPAPDDGVPAGTEEAAPVGSAASSADGAASLAAFLGTSLNPFALSSSMTASNSAFVSAKYSLHAVSYSGANPQNSWGSPQSVMDNFREIVTPCEQRHYKAGGIERPERGLQVAWFFRTYGDSSRV